MTTKLFSIARLFVVASVLMVGTYQLVSAEMVTGEILGTFRDTSSAADWNYKYLGGQNLGTNKPNESYNWESQRTYVDGVLDKKGYTQTFSIEPKQHAWNTNHPWISGRPTGNNTNGYFSYVTEIFDDISSTQGASFNGLLISYASDDHLHAIFVNGVALGGFKPEPWYYQGWIGDQVTLLLGDVNWNIDGVNTIEFIVHNSAYPTHGYADNPTGLSASIQAVYLIDNTAPPTTAVPEPATLLITSMGIAGLAAVRRLQKKQM